jgi:hypothetical protein
MASDEAGTHHDDWKMVLFLLRLGRSVHLSHSDMLYESWYWFLCMSCYRHWYFLFS